MVQMPGEVPQTRVKLAIHFENEKEAKNIASSIGVDDDEYVTTIVEGCTVRGEVTANTIEGARRAADDWLACLMAIIKKD